MKKLIIYLSFIATVGFSADVILGKISELTWTGTGADRVARFGSWSPLSLNPIAWYRAEDNSNDYASTNNGTWAGTISYTNGIIGKCFNMNGLSYIDIGTPSTMMVGGDVTLSAWVKASYFSNFESIFGSGYLAGTAGYGIFADSSGYRFQARNISTFSWPLANYSQTDWIHIIGIRRGTTQEIWTNGVLSASETLDIGDSTPLYNWGIGSRYSGELSQWGFNFVGLIDEVIFYNKALTQDEIGKIYNYR